MEQFLLLHSRGMSLADTMKIVRCHSKQLTNFAEENLTKLSEKGITEVSNSCRERDL